MEFAHVAKALPTKQIACQGSRDHRGRTVKAMERAHVEMVEMRVGKEHDVDLGEVANGQCGRRQAFWSDRKTGQPDSDPRKENWIREKSLSRKN